MITVYSRPGCGSCTATKLWLRKNKIPFEERDAEGSIIHGYSALPVVVTDTETWSGFRIDKLAALKTHHPGDDSGVIDG